ncbi:hypothetical protein GTY85_04445 [Streptomyces sp. SID8377]|nr:hypothetical protein [Streptomyces sp. SID8377]MYX32769.1 hypothetical protein [Streptomyces sp. SID8377]
MAKAAAFADRLPWLTTAQREEVVRVYTADRLDLARHIHERTAQRAAELDDHYTRHYAQLRRRLFRATVAAVLAAAAVCLPVPLLLLTTGKG